MKERQQKNNGCGKNNTAEEETRKYDENPDSEEREKNIM